MSDPRILDRVRAKVEAARVVDLHTHLFPPEFGALCLSGPDELLTYHYLIAETLRFTRSDPAVFLAMPKPLQADLIWKTLFVERTPLSEAASGVAATLVALGLDPGSKDLRDARKKTAAMPVEERIDLTFILAGVKEVTMTNDPLNVDERRVYDGGFRGNARFRTALRIDPVLLEERGDLDWTRRYVEEWAHRLSASYVAVSLPPDLDLGGHSPPVRRLRAILPVLRDEGLPLALMIGVRRQVNPRLALAGDGSGIADLTGLAKLLDEFADVRFLVTTLARENTQELCVLARKFANLTPFGCWWFMNNPSLIRETTSMRLEMLGTSFIPQHSDARVLESLIYKWRHARRAIAECLADRYERLESDGILLSDERMDADVEALMRGNAIEAMR